MTIKEYIEKYISKGFTTAQARSFTAQQIILSKIEKSKYVDKVLLKGGVVMYNITQEQRRSTLDLDFDLIRVDIQSNDKIAQFINDLNNKDSNYHVKVSGLIEELHHQDYKGKRIKVEISDESESIKFKMDIGVHTLLAIEQKKMCFNFEEGEELTLLVNPPEQIFAEKLFSLVKIGPISERFKDIDDMYYLCKNLSLDIDKVKECLELITVSKPYGIKDVSEVISKADEYLNDSFFKKNYIANNGSWLNIDYDQAVKEIIKFIYKI